MGLLNNPNLSGLAQGLLAASGPSAMPVSFGQALAAGMQSRQEAQARQRQQQMDALRMQILQQQMAEAKRKQEASARISRLIQDPTKPYQASPDMLFPGEEMPEGWKQQMTPEEVRGGLLGNLAVLDPSATAKSLLQNDTKPTAQIMSAQQLRGAGFDVPGNGTFEVKFGPGGQILDVNSLGGRDEYDITTDQFGNVIRLHKGTGQVERLGSTVVQPNDQPPATSPEPSSAPSIEEAALKGTGPLAAVQSGLGNVFGPFMEGEAFPQTDAARQRIRLFNQEAKQALVNNPRFPVAEQKIIQDMLADPGRVFTDPDSERGKIVRLREFLTNKLSQNNRTLQSQVVTQDTRGQLTDQNAAIQRVLNLMGSGDKQRYRFNPQTGKLE